MKIKRKALSVLSCLALIASSLPSTTVLVSGAVNTLTEPGNPQYVTINGTGADQGKKLEALFANGTDITVTYNEKTQSNTVTYTKQKGDGNTVEAEIEGVATNACIFAGCHGSSEAVGNDDDPVEITIDGAHLNTVFGGGLHESTVNNVKITVKGEANLNWVCGGGANCFIRCNEAECADKGWQSGKSDSSATLVKKAEINVETGAIANAVYGGGEGFSKTEKTTVNIKDGQIGLVSAGGSNGYTGTADVNIEGGTITKVQSVNRGTIDSSDVAVTGGTITNLYIGGETADDVTGTVNNSNVDITGGTVKELHAGKSNSQTLDVSQETYSFSANPSSVEKYNADISDKKDEENAYYYFKAYKADGQEADGSELAKNIKLVSIMIRNISSKGYQHAFVVANGETVVATDVKDHDVWKATKITCEDGSYVETNYDIIDLFGGKHNDKTDTLTNTDVTLDGTTHIEAVWGGGWHQSNTGTAKVTVKNNAKVSAVQGGAANFYYNVPCKDSTCAGYKDDKNAKKCFEKPAGKDANDYDVSPNARVQNTTVKIESIQPYVKPDGNTENQMLIYGGGECFAYTGSATMDILGGTFPSDTYVSATGSNGYIGGAKLTVDGDVTIPRVSSAIRGIVAANSDIEVKNGATITELWVGADDNAEIKGSNVTVESGGTVGNVKFGKNGSSQIQPESTEGFTVKADGGTINQFNGTDVDYTKQDLVCNHDKYDKTEETAGTPATCAADGTYDYWKCSNCKRYVSLQEGEIKDVTNVEGNAVDNEKIKMTQGDTHHVFLESDVVAKVDPTCTATGKKAYAVCSVCHAAYAEAVGEPGAYTFNKVESEDDLTIEALGHANEEIPAIEATCTQNGRTSGVKCTRCNAILVPPVLTDMVPHTYGQEIAEKKATCKDPGTKAHYQCSVCKKLFTKSGEVYTEVTDAQLEIPATNEHTWGAYTPNNDATCTTPGTKTAECSVCGAKDTKEDTDNPAKGHTISEEMIPEVPATCTDDGVMAHYECTECHALFIDEVVEEETVKKEVTAEQLVIKAEGHKAVEDKEVKATCTSTGLTAGSHCDVCGAILKEQLATPMIPHTEKVIDAVAPTCTQFGWSAGSECAVCHGVLTVRVVVPALGHDYKNGVCTRCGEKDPNFTTNPTNPTDSSTVQPTTKVPANVSKLTQAKVTKLKVKSKAKNKINVSWKKVANAKGYEIEVSKSNTFKKSAKVLKKNTKKLKLTIKNKKLKSKKTYYVRVRAYTTYKAADGSTKKVYSKWNVVLRKVKIK